MVVVKPSSYRYELGDFAVSSPSFRNTVEYPNLVGDARIGDRFELDFAHLSGDTSAEFFVEHQASYSGFFPTPLADEYVAGIDDTEAADEILQGGWHYGAPPVITGVEMPGRMSLRIIFVRLIPSIYVPGGSSLLG